MNKNSPVKFSEHFLTVTDPRVVGRSDHKLIDISTSPPEEHEELKLFYG